MRSPASRKFQGRLRRPNWILPNQRLVAQAAICSAGRDA